MTFENLNQDKFERLLMNVNQGTMPGHIKVMLQPGTWATQVEVFAAATYFQVPIYYLVETKATPITPKWHIVKPLDIPSKFCFPDGSPQPTSVSHFELVYYPYSHYNCVMSLSSTSLPTIVEEHVYVNKDVL